MNQIKYLPINGRKGKHPTYRIVRLQDKNDPNIKTYVNLFEGTENDALMEILTIRKGGFILKTSDKYTLYITNFDISSNTEYKTIKLVKPTNEDIFQYATNLPTLASSLAYIEGGKAARTKKIKRTKRRTKHRTRRQ